MPIKIALILFTSAVMAIPAQAQQQKSQAAVKSCQDTAATTSEMNACAAKAARAADDRLNKSYREVMCHLEPKEKDLLKVGQRAWITFRDADCAFFGGAGGSLDPMNSLYCKAALSNQRAAELEAWPPNAPRDALAPCN